jgi:glucan 1,3-beta-glucosidase
MRLSSFLIATLPAVVYAAGSVGFALGTKNADGSCKGQADYAADFKAIAANSQARIVRGYAASDCNCAQNILPAAKAEGFQVILGIWCVILRELGSNTDTYRADTDQSYNLDLAAIQKYGTAYPDTVYAVTVGSETLYRGNFTGATLAAKMQDVRKATNNLFKIGTADSWNKYADGTADAVIKSGPDILLVNAFGFWQGSAINKATNTYFDDITQAFTHIENVAGGLGKIEMWTGETGWPTSMLINCQRN